MVFKYEYGYFWAPSYDVIYHIMTFMTSFWRPKVPRGDRSLKDDSPVITCDNGLTAGPCAGDESRLVGGWKGVACTSLLSHVPYRGLAPQRAQSCQIWANNRPNIDPRQVVPSHTLSANDICFIFYDDLECHWTCTLSWFRVLRSTVQAKIGIFCLRASWQITT